MAYFQLAEKQITVHDGEMTVGSGAGMHIAIPGDHGPAALAVVTMKADGSVAVRRGFDGAPVKVNGVHLGVEPTPLIHGDKLEVAGHELRFGDDKKSGSTQFLSGAELAELAKLRLQVASGTASKSGAPTASTGGRLVSLTDGREYVILAKGLTFGRDASCDVVISSTEASRNHAEIASGPDGYYVIDTSTNGVWVNSKRVDGTQTLGRADVIRLGPEEFRFYADKASAVAAVAAGAVPAAPTPVAAPIPVAAPALVVPPPPPVVASPKPAPPIAPAAVPAGPVAKAPPAPRPAPAAAKVAPAEEKKDSPLGLIIIGVVAAAAAAVYFFFLK